MFRSLVYHLLPHALRTGRELCTALSRLDSSLGNSRHTAEAAGHIEQAKPGVYRCLRTRFPEPVAKILTLKILNIYLAKYHFRARSTEVVSRPFGLVVDPSNMCGLACPGCVHSASSSETGRFDWVKGTLPKGRLQRLLNLYGPYLVGTLFHNWGEPLLNLNTPSLIHDAKRYLVRTDLSTSLSVTKFDPYAYVESGLDLMILAIDGVTQPVYQQFRRNGDIKLVLDNIRRLAEARRRHRSRTPLLIWNYLAFEHNRHEIPLARETARNLGVDQFQVARPFDVSWDDPSIRVAATAERLDRFDRTSIRRLLPHRPWERVRPDVEAIGAAFERSWTDNATPEPRHPEGHTCHWLYCNIVADATGRILPCCGAPRPDIRLVFGHLDTEPSPFNTAMHHRARTFFAQGVIPTGEAPFCNRCEWDQTTVNIGGPTVRRYFQRLSPIFFHPRSLDLLSDWQPTTAASVCTTTFNRDAE